VKCKFHVSTELVAVKQPAHLQQGAMGMLSPERISLRCPVMFNETRQCPCVQQLVSRPRASKSKTQDLWMQEDVG